MLLRKMGLTLSSLLGVMFVCTAFGANVQSTAATANSPLIKAGTAMFANLDSTINSDSPNSIVTATIIDGRYKGAKLVGRLSKDEQGQSPITTLRFSSMRLNGKWVKAKNINAYGIDFDAARIVLITEPEYAELQRTALTMSSSLLKSYSIANKVKLGSGTDVGILFMSNVT